MNSNSENIEARLEYLRAELRAERISYGELAELQSLKQYIDPNDVELLEAAGVPEFQENPVNYTHVRLNPKTGFKETLNSEMRFIKGWIRIK